MTPAEKLVKQFEAVFGEPRTSDPELFLKEFTKAITGWDAAVLQKAGDRLVKQSKFWPKPAEVNELAESFVADLPQHDPFSRINVDWTADVIRLANRLIRSDIGREAAAEGWITQLHDFCRVHRKLPGAHAIARLKREARLFEDAYAQVARGNGGKLQASLKVLGESMLEKRNRLAAMTGERDE